jgi:hypothetical protein
MPSIKEKTKVSYWIDGAILSGLLLLIFLFLQQYEVKMLLLDVKWLAIAAIPLLIALLRSGLITEIEFFGIKARLNTSIGDSDLLGANASEALAPLSDDNKQSETYIRRLPKNKRSKIKILTFREGLNNYYQTNAVITYFRYLPNLQYVSVVNNNGIFIGLIPIEFFVLEDRENKVDEAVISSFIETLSENLILVKYKSIIITETISDAENLFQTLLKVRRSKNNLLAVVTENRQFLGIVTVSSVESKIADIVITVYQKRN